MAVNLGYALFSLINIYVAIISPTILCFCTIQLQLRKFSAARLFVVFRDGISIERMISFDRVEGWIAIYRENRTCRIDHLGNESVTYSGSRMRKDLSFEILTFARVWWVNG